ncbi:MAG: protoporphyrinogen oxidase HemJ [Rhodospirillales bacterium]|nr:protoporphyrinogen oxidase HemJ [Rhodospirillales bacterium]
MEAFLSGGYLWFKAIHVLAVIAWMAGLLYLPRLFVYHCETVPGSIGSERFKVMEGRLYRFIMTPATVAAWIFGLLTAFAIDVWSDGWFHAKLLFVVLLQASHELMGRWLRDFAQDCNRKSAKFFRIVNEVPTVLMIGIVIFVVVKPF